MKEIKTIFTILGSCSKLVRGENKNKLDRAERAINRELCKKKLEFGSRNKWNDL